MAIGGTMTFLRGGSRMRATGSWSISVGGSMGVPRMALDGVAGFGEEVIAPRATGKLFKLEGMTLADIQAIRNETLQFDLNDGSRIVYRGACMVGEAKHDPKSGEIDVEFVALSAEEA